jgi:hypothetical protein
MKSEIKIFKLIGIFNSEEENYFKLKVKYRNTFKYIVPLSEFVSSLGFENFGRNFVYSDTNKQRAFKSVFGVHYFLKNAKYKVHMVFAEDTIHFIVKCSLFNLRKLFGALQKIADFS